MLIFLDTEFTDFRNCHLISLGMVAEDGNELYAELTDYPHHLSSTFVRDVIEPLLGVTPGAIVGNRVVVRDAVCGFLTQYPDAVLACDYQGDWNLLVGLLGPDRAAGLRAVNVYPRLDQARMERYFAQHRVPRHHALHDARANQYAYVPPV